MSLNRISLIAMVFLAMCVMCCTQKPLKKVEVLNDSIAVDTTVVDTLCCDSIIEDTMVVELSDSI